MGLLFVITLITVTRYVLYSSYHHSEDNDVATALQTNPEIIFWFGFPLIACFLILCLIEYLDVVSCIDYLSCFLLFAWNILSFFLTTFFSYFTTWFTPLAFFYSFLLMTYYESFSFESNSRNDATQIPENLKLGEKGKRRYILHGQQRKGMYHITCSNSYKRDMIAALILASHLSLLMVVIFTRLALLCVSWWREA